LSFLPLRRHVFGSLGGPEIVLIVVLALLLFGPRRLPQIARTIGRTMGEFRKASHDFRSSLEQEIELEEVKQAKETVSSAAREVAAGVAGMSEDADGREPVSPYPPTPPESVPEQGEQSPPASANAEPEAKS
jgi:Tat protein translocase TatB subunit